jgi:colicin import membrane protein
MIRKHENAISIKAGLLALAVHILLLGGMIISINWKAAHAPIEIANVELWDKLPAPTVSGHKDNSEKKPVKLPPDPPKIDEPKPEPEPKVEEKPEPKDEKVDIALEQKKKQEKEEKQRKLMEEKKEKEAKEKLIKEKALEEKRKQADLEKLQQAMRDESLKDKQEAKRNHDLEKIKKDMLSDEMGQDDKKASAAMQGEVNSYIAKIQAKVRGNVNKSLCGTGNPVLKLKVDILPTGEISGSPKLIKSSGNTACDEAVDRAILASQPLPLPSDPAAKSQFRNLILIFKPND